VAFTGVDAFGVLGLLLLLGGFVSNAFGKLAASTYAYQLLNLFGSGILAVYAYLIESWVFLPLEVVWAAVALIAVVKKARGAPGAPGA
jgi:hypothetical protein